MPKTKGDLCQDTWDEECDIRLLQDARFMEEDLLDTRFIEEDRKSSLRLWVFHRAVAATKGANS